MPVAAIVATHSRQRTVPVTCSTNRFLMWSGSETGGAETFATTGTEGARTATFAKASAIASAAGCISAQWKGAETGRGTARRPAEFLPMAATRCKAPVLA